MFLIMQIFSRFVWIAGTGNGMAKSLLHNVNETCNVENATFAIIQGHIVASFILVSLFVFCYCFEESNFHFIFLDIMFRL